MSTRGKYFFWYTLWVIVLVVGILLLVKYDGRARVIASFVGMMVVFSILIPAGILNSEM